MLAVTGRLNLRKCMAPAFIRRYRPKCWPASQTRAMDGWKIDSRGRADRAHAFTFTSKRLSLVTPLLADFDFCRDRQAVAPVRFATTQPTQVLAMLNGDVRANAQAAALADFACKQDAAAQRRSIRRPRCEAGSRSWRLVPARGRRERIDRQIELADCKIDRRAAWPKFRKHGTYGRKGVRVITAWMVLESERIRLSGLSSRNPGQFYRSN